jgi:hypothetical protein
MNYRINNVAIERIFSSSEKRDGTPYISKYGKPFSKVDIYIDKSAVDDVAFGGKLSMFDYNGVAKSWSEGTPITGVVSQNGEYWNFELDKVDSSSELPKVWEAIEELRTRIENLEVGGGGVSAQEEKELVDIDDLPF